MEHYRQFKRSCIRVCLDMHRNADSNYTKNFSNTILYNTAGIPRFDIFTLTHLPGIITVLSIKFITPT
ncbi:hypothetical protein M0804_014161 [Polistes exclamans]|nr:hypothetical protein M0804_014161 [Polistes exclamans]